jgi:RNA-directed DNA polymerase
MRRTGCDGRGTCRFRSRLTTSIRSLLGHYAYYGIAGNIRALQRVHRAVERYWRKMLSSRSWKGEVRWPAFHRIKERFPLLRPKLYLPYRGLQALAAL